MLAALREIRRELLDVTGQRTGFPIGVLARFENGQTRPSISDLRRLAQHHGADVHALLDVFGYL